MGELRIVFDDRQRRANRLFIARVVRALSRHLGLPVPRPEYANDRAVIDRLGEAITADVGVDEGRPGDLFSEFLGSSYLGRDQGRDIVERYEAFKGRRRRWRDYCLGRIPYDQV